MPLSRHSVGTYPGTSSYTTCQGTFGHSRLTFAETLWTDPGLKSGISARERISTARKEEKKKKAQAGKEWSNILPNSLKRGKSHHQTDVYR